MDNYNLGNIASQLVASLKLRPRDEHFVEVTFPNIGEFAEPLSVMTRVMDRVEDILVSDEARLESRMMTRLLFKATGETVLKVAKELFDQITGYIQAHRPSGGGSLNSGPQPALLPSDGPKGGRGAAVTLRTLVAA